MADLRSVIQTVNDLVSRIYALSDISEIGIIVERLDFLNRMLWLTSTLTKISLILSVLFTSFQNISKTLIGFDIILNGAGDKQRKQASA